MKLTNETGPVYFFVSHSGIRQIGRNNISQSGWDQKYQHWSQYSSLIRNDKDLLAGSWLFEVFFLSEIEEEYIGGIF